MISGSLIYLWHQYYDLPVKHLPSTAIWCSATAPGSLWVDTGQQRLGWDSTLAVDRSSAEHQGEAVLPCSFLRIKKREAR